MPSKGALPPKNDLSVTRRYCVGNATVARIAPQTKAGDPPQPSDFGYLKPKRARRGAVLSGAAPIRQGRSPSQSQAVSTVSPVAKSTLDATTRFARSYILAKR